MKLVIDNWATVLDVVYKISAICLVIGLWIAYRQYRKTIELARITVIREAVRLAAEQADRYGGDLIKKVGDLHESIRKSGSQYLSRCAVTIDENKLTLNNSKATDADKKAITAHFQEITLTLNAIEGFAIFFASNVADDNVGYIECGRSFVKFFEDNFPLYCIGNRVEHYYQASQSLYWRWKKRVVQEDLVRTHEALNQQCVITRSKLNPSHLQPQRPIGS